MKPENNEAFTKGIGEPSFYPNAPVDPTLLPFYPKPEELSKYAYRPDWDYVIQQVDTWQKQFESDIVPLIKKG